MDRKRWVARRSCGEIFTFISFSDSLNMEKSCCFLSWCDTLRLLRLSASREGRPEAHEKLISAMIYRHLGAGGAPLPPPNRDLLLREGSRGDVNLVLITGPLG